MLSFALFSLIVVVVWATRHLSLIGVKIVASLTDLQTAITANTAAVNAVTTQLGGMPPSP